MIEEAGPSKWAETRPVVRISHCDAAYFIKDSPFFRVTRA